jgi:hypothetical protein
VSHDPWGEDDGDDPDPRSYRIRPTVFSEASGEDDLATGGHVVELADGDDVLDLVN